MTDMQSMMLAVCFGVVVGSLIGNIVIITKCAIEEHREKKRTRKESKNKQ